VFGPVDLPAHLILLLVDLFLFPSRQFAAVQRAIRADFLVDGGVAYLQPGRLRGAELAGRDAVADAVLLILAARIHFIVTVVLGRGIVLANTVAARKEAAATPTIMFFIGLSSRSGSYFVPLALQPIKCGGTREVAATGFMARIADSDG